MTSVDNNSGTVTMCVAKYESLVSHHEAPLSNMATREKEHKTRCRGLFVATKASTHPGLHTRALLSLLAIVFCWSSMCSAVAATGTDDRHPLLVQDELVWSGSSLTLDQRPPPIVPLLMPPVPDHEDASKTLYIPSKRSIATDGSKTKGDFDVPQPFDTGLSNNFTSSCAKFLGRMRTNNTFTSCHPFSLLLQTSSDFFDASKSVLRITQTLDATCGVNATQCRTTLDDFARELMSPTACKTDYDNNNPLVLQAYNGLVAYQPAYQASCLKDDEGNYCFANAVSNTTSPTDSYAYYLPIGQELPGGSRPTCNACLQEAMGVFSRYANNVTQPVSQTYTSAAQQLSIACGSTFVNVTAAPLKGAAPTTSASIPPTMTLILMFVLYIFQ
ncbi:hypothetical protein NX059_005483 [Plenodomus lindquistii]|nr:hypothetical protein NX059_005483 [Plenodomus lindquistii]